MPTSNLIICKQKLIHCLKIHRKNLDATRKSEKLSPEMETDNSTRFRKPGPMSDEDWRRFRKWAHKQKPKRKNRLPNMDPPQHTARPSTTRKSSFAVPKPLSERRKRDLEARAARIAILSEPKHRREKYKPPPVPTFPWSPILDPKKPPKPEKHRPFEWVKLPHWWYHEELETAFWRDVRFPLSRSALKYKMTKRTRRLVDHSEPRLHCPLPEKIEEPMPPRTRMNAEQWAVHLKRLEELSDPGFKETRARRVEQKMLHQKVKETFNRVRVGQEKKSGHWKPI